MMSKAYQFYQSIGSPSLIVSPMVDVSHLPYRMLCRNHGAQLCFTPMLNSSRFASQPQYRAANFVVVPEDRPLIVQFCGDDPQTLLEGLNTKFLFFHFSFSILISLSCQVC